MPLILPDEVYFSREGYTQTGWRDAASGRVYSLGDSVSEGAGTIYYPVWTVNRYTVTFRFGNGGEDLVLTVAYGAAFPEDEDLAHQANEYIRVSQMVKAMKIYAAALMKLAAE